MGDLIMLRNYAATVATFNFVGVFIMGGKKANNGRTRVAGGGNSAKMENFGIDRLVSTW